MRIPPLWRGLPYDTAIALLGTLGPVKAMMTIPASFAATRA
jgi:hypothetical protein